MFDNLKNKFLHSLVVSVPLSVASPDEGSGAFHFYRVYLIKFSFSFVKIAAISPADFQSQRPTANFFQFLQS